MVAIINEQNDVVVTSLLTGESETIQLEADFGMVSDILCKSFALCLISKTGNISLYTSVLASHIAFTKLLAINSQLEPGNWKIINFSNRWHQIVVNSAK